MRRGGQVFTLADALAQSRAIAHILALGRLKLGEDGLTAAGQHAAERMLEVSQTLQAEAKRRVQQVYSDESGQIALELYRQRKGTKTVDPASVKTAMKFVTESWVASVPGRIKSVRRRKEGTKLWTKTKMPMGTLLDTVENIYYKFTETPEGKKITEAKDKSGIRRSLFCSLIARELPWVVPISRAPRRICVCTVCEQMVRKIFTFSTIKSQSH
jgi:hypothetical protein